MTQWSTSMLRASSQPYRDNDAEKKNKFPTVNFSLNLSFRMWNGHVILLISLQWKGGDTWIYKAHVMISKNNIKYVHLKCQSGLDQVYYLDFSIWLLSHLQYWISQGDSVRAYACGCITFFLHLVWRKANNRKNKCFLIFSHVGSEQNGTSGSLAQIYVNGS